MKTKRFLAFLLAAVMCLSLAGCAGQGDPNANTNNNDTANQQQEAGEPDAEQYLNVYLGAEPSTFDISLRTDTYSSPIMLNTMEGLIRTEYHDGEYVATPAEAETWDISDDQTVWTFHLRDGLKWQDGEPVTAQQYVYSLQRTADPATGSPNTIFLEPILNFNEVNTGAMPVDQLGVRAVDDQTLEITLSAPTPSFLSMISSSVYYPQRQDVIEANGEKFGAEADTYIGNGPFKVTEWTHNSNIKLEKNENYWDADTVKLETVNIAIITDSSTSHSSFLTGELDIINNVDTQEWKMQFEADEANVSAPYTTATMNFQFYNYKDALFSNVNIRKAFTLCLDLDDLNEMCYGGLRDPAEGWVVPNMTVGDKNYRDEAGDMIAEMKADLEAEGKTPKDLLLQGMEELGLGNDPSTLDVTYSLAGTSEWYRTMGEYLQQVYKQELGVDIEISYAEWGIFQSNVQSGNYQIGMMSWGAYYNDPYDVLTLYTSGYDAIGTGWANDEFDQIVAASAHETDDAQRLQDYIDAETILLKDECVVCPLATTVYNRFLKSYVYGYDEEGAFTSTGYKYMYTSGR